MPDSPPLSRDARALLALLLLGQFLVVLDISVVNVALPSIQSALGLSSTGLQWVVNGYTIAYAGFLLLGGRLADVIGQRRAFMAGVALFAAGSLVGGLAGSSGVLLTGRVVQGLGAAVLSPATLTILLSSFAEGPQRARAMGWWMAIGAASNRSRGPANHPRGLGPTRTLRETELSRPSPMLGSPPQPLNPVPRGQEGRE